MKIWTFKKYCDEHGNTDIDPWRDGLPKGAQAKLHNILKYMEITPSWKNTPYIRPLRGYKGILEIKFEDKNIQYRPLGCYAPQRTFIILFGAEKKGNKFIPPSAPQTAIERKEIALTNPRCTRDYF